MRSETEAALRACDWSGYLELHFGRDRILAFRRVASRLTDEEYWSLLGAVIVHVERPGADVHDLLRSDRPERQCIMTEGDRVFFADLPTELRVWRGDTNTDDPGWSWTLERAMAEWFARQRERIYGGQARLRTATCLKAGTVGYFGSLEEAEILVDPSRLRDVREVPVTLPPF